MIHMKEWISPLLRMEFPVYNISFPRFRNDSLKDFFTLLHTFSKFLKFENVSIISDIFISMQGNVLRPLH